MALASRPVEVERATALPSSPPNAEPEPATPKEPPRPKRFPRRSREASAKPLPDADAKALLGRPLFKGGTFEDYRDVFGYGPGSAGGLGGDIRREGDAG